MKRPSSLLAALLGLALLASIGGHARARAVPSAEALLACLAASRRALLGHVDDFRALERELGTGAKVGTPRVRPVPAFSAFEGHWRGRWQGVPTTHLWRSVTPTTQLVVIRDGPLLRRGVNVAPGGRRLCGIVEEPTGPDRLHEGLWLGPTHLRWWTPEALYDERILMAAAGPAYAIAQRAPTAPDYETRYLPWKPVAGPLAHVDLAGVAASWSIHGDRIHVVLRGQTAGWLAIGFGDGPDLPGTRFVMAHVVDGRAAAESHLAVPGAHRPFGDLGIPDRVDEVAGRERDGETLVTFSVPTSVPDPRVADVRPRARGTVWLAWAHGDDFTEHSHARRAAPTRW